MNTTEELLDLKEKIEKAKTNKAQAEGRKEQLMIELNEKHDCKTLKAAQLKLKKLDRQIKIKTEELNEGMEKLRGEYEWV